MKVLIDIGIGIGFISLVFIASIFVPMILGYLPLKYLDHKWGAPKDHHMVQWTIGVMMMTAVAVLYAVGLIVNKCLLH